MKRHLFYIILTAFIVLLTACGTTQKTVFTGEPNSEAEAAYRRAVQQMEGGSYDDAVKSFHAIKLKYPYATRWATLCDLRIADAFRYNGEYAQAAASYQAFIRTYPAHSDIAYAMYQAANCYYEMMPSSFFILPDPWQRDRATTQQARSAFELYLKRFPNDENASTAREQHAEVLRRLSNHELYVAEYNFKHKAYQGSVNRLVDLIAAYPNAEITPKAHILLAHSYIKLNDPVAAKRTLNQLIEKYPDSEYIEEARRWLAANPEVP